MAVIKTLYNEWTLPVLGVIVTGGILTAVVILTVKWYKSFKLYQNMPGIPASDYSVLYGNLHKLPTSGEGRLKFALSSMRRFNGKFHRFWIGPFVPCITTYHPDTVRKVFQSSAPKSRGLGSAYGFVMGWIGEGLIVTNGERWSRSRRLLTPAFHFDILKDYIQVYNEGADNLFKKLDILAENGTSFDIYPLITLATLETILKCSLSYDEDVQKSGHPYANAVNELATLWFDRVRRPWLWPDWMFRLSPMGREFYKKCDYVHKLAEKVIAQRRIALKKEGVPKSRRMDFIDILLTAKDEDGQTMTDLEIRNEVDTFMFAGHDTTAAGISWFLLTLAQHPEYQEMVREEIESVLDGRNSDDLKWDDMSQLKMLAICMKESMRLYSIIPFIQRQLNEDLELDGHRIPAGTLVNVAIYLLHRNPAVWDQPDEFRPERFLLENKKTQDPHAFVPFSAGSRNCIGQNFALNETKVMIARILRRYKVELAPDHDLPVQNPTAILRPENGVWLKLQRLDIEST